MIKSTLLLLSSYLLNPLLLLLAFLQSSPPVMALHLSNETDKLALLAFKDGIHEDPLRVMDSWNESLHFCKWRGVWCSNRHQGRVTVLNLIDRKLAGSLPPHIGNMSFLRQINLSSNNLKGEIPQEIGRLFRLRSLDLSRNTLQGKIPANLSSCSKLTVIAFHYNELTGEIPTELGNLQNSLRWLGFYGNRLTGGIPQWLGNASSLEFLNLGQNNLHGSIPNELGRLVNLRFLQFNLNDLSGNLPPSIFNLSSLSILSVGENRLQGRLPPDIFFTLLNLQSFLVGLNSFHGEVPPSLINATKLKRFDMGYNSFSGAVPSNLGSLKDLAVFSLFRNQLETTVGEGLGGFVTSLTNCSNLQHLQLADNRFEGEFPASIVNLSSNLQTLLLGTNAISGEIPDQIGNLVGLRHLSFSRMNITGEIPSSMGKLNSISRLYLQGNKISGSVPSSLGNLTALLTLFLSDNNLSGLIPPSLGNCSQLLHIQLGGNNLIGNVPKQLFSLSRVVELYLEMNALTGELPLEIENMNKLAGLSVRNNQFSGGIPNSLGNCLMLELLEMDGNMFQGDIPPSFSSLKSLTFIDLSRNNLSGQVPKFFENFTLLQHLNLSFNDFVGELPVGGVFGNASAVSVTGNQRLCGGIHQLGLPTCEEFRRKQEINRLHLVISLSVSCSILLIIAALLILLWYKRKSPRSRAAIDMKLPEGFPLISYAELSDATNGFSSSNLIGEGGFGSVYKGSLGLDGMSVAVKVLNLLQKGASKSFIAECEVLKNIRHRNLIKIVTVCSSIDHKGIDFKALVYQFMQNGNLEEWLHPSDVEEQADTRKLSFIQRLNIAIDVACAVEYLHHHCQPPIVHGDLKPSNILLDEDMVAHVGDFGLARFLSPSHLSQSISTGANGTIGYVAPEYGVNNKASVLGDVYGFGILLLEMITGKRPTNAIFKDGFTIHQFIETSLPERLVHVLDPSLVQEIEDAENPKARNRGVRIRETLVAVAKVGVLCSMDSPNQRMEMKRVVAELSGVRNKFLGNRS